MPPEQVSVGDSPEVLRMNPEKEMQLHSRRSFLRSAIGVVLLSTLNTPRAYGEETPTHFSFEPGHTEGPPYIRTPNEWLRVKYPELQKIIQDTIHNLAADNPNEREEASEKLAQYAHFVGGHINPLPAVFHTKTDDLERKKRLQACRNGIEGIHAASRLPPSLENTALNILSFFEAHSGNRITYENDTVKNTLSKHVLNLDGTTGSLWETISRICAQTDCAFTVSSGNRICIVEKGERRKWLGNDGAFGLFHKPDAKNEIAELELLMEPKWGESCRLQDANIRMGQLPRTNLSLPAWRQKKWNIRHGGGIHPSRSLSVEAKENHNPNASLIGMQCAIVYGMERTEQELFVNQPAVRMGNQTICVHYCENDPNKLEIRKGLWEDIPWPNTRHEQDTLTYWAGDAGSYEFYNREGKPVAYERGPADINLRRMVIPFSIASVPHRIVEKNYKVLDQKTINIAFPIERLFADK